MDKLEACRAMYADAIERLNLALEDLEKSEIERAGFAMEAKNTKERAALLEQLNGQLEKDAKSLAKQHENDILALEAMKDKLKRKNEQIERLKEANKGAMIGVMRMRKKIADMKDRETSYKICIKILKEQRSENQRLRENCDTLYKTIIKFRSAAKELLDVELGGAET